MTGGERMALERYGHGGDLETAAENYGRPPEEWLDFSANINPWGPPDVVGRLMKERWREIARYPDPASRRLRRKLAETWQIPPESILVGNGAAELIDLIMRDMGPEEAVLARPSFSEYEEAAAKAGMRVKDVYLCRDQNFAVTDAAPFLRRTVMLGHPNNPTGRLVPRHVLEEIGDSGSQMILDEAFMDFVPDEKERSWIRQAAESGHVAVIRSMTKFYAIPGIRLGFLVAHPDRIRRLEGKKTPWSVNFLAQLIGEAVLDEHEYAARTRAWLLEERPFLFRKLEELGLAPVPGDANFLLVFLPKESGWTAACLQQAMARKGILLRDASTFRGLDESCFRIAIRRREENLRLLAALKECLACP